METLTGSDGQTIGTYGYTAYGKDDETSFTGVDKPDPSNPDAEPYNMYRFNGKRWDQNSESYDMGFRDYSPGLNRFLTRDSYNGALADMGLGIDPWTGNRYAFTGGNPISGIELDGHLPIYRPVPEFESQRKAEELEKQEEEKSLENVLDQQVVSGGREKEDQQYLRNAGFPLRPDLLPNGNASFTVKDAIRLSSQSEQARQKFVWSFSMATRVRAEVGGPGIQTLIQCRSIGMQFLVQRVMLEHVPGQRPH